MTEKALTLIQKKRFQEVKALIQNMNPVDIATFFGELEAGEAAVLFRLLPKEPAAEAFAYMEPEIQEKLIAALTDRELKNVLDSQFMDDTVDMLEEMPAGVVNRVLKVASSEDRQMLNRLLQYGENTAGSMMTTEYVCLKKSLTVRQAFSYLRKHAVDKETVYTCYVTGAKRVLEGVVTVRELLLAGNETPIGQIMESNVISVQTSASDEEAANLFQKYDMLSLPVVDGEGRLVGIITVDDAVDVLQEANTEDFEKMAAMAPSGTPYLKTSVFTHARKRVVWLLFLMLSGIVTGQIISHYEDAFAAVPLLVSFIPMLMDTGGNCGSQSSTLVIRGMALGEIRLRDILKVVWKECRVSGLVGLVLAPINLLWIFFRYHSFTIAATVGVSIFVTVVLAKLTGCLLPMAAQKLRLDPAIMASPLITTVVDACSIFVYFNVAMAFLRF